jgi:hypothetical protein
VQALQLRLASRTGGLAPLGRAARRSPPLRLDASLDVAVMVPASAGCTGDGDRPRTHDLDFDRRVRRLTRWNLLRRARLRRSLPSLVRRLPHRRHGLRGLRRTRRLISARRPRRRAPKRYVRAQRRRARLATRLAVAGRPLPRQRVGGSGSASNRLARLGSARAASPVAWITDGPLAQWQSCRLLICRFRVRVPGGPPIDLRI